MRRARRTPAEFSVSAILKKVRKSFTDLIPEKAILRMKALSSLAPSQLLGGFPRLRVCLNQTEIPSMDLASTINLPLKLRQYTCLLWKQTFTFSVVFKLICTDS